MRENDVTDKGKGEKNMNLARRVCVHACPYLIGALDGTHGGRVEKEMNLKSRLCVHSVN
jgi:hypothetical protein